MNYVVDVLPEAEFELQSLKSQLQTESPGTANRMIDELERLFDQLAVFPYSYQETSIQIYRRAFLMSCRYTVFYQIRSNIVEIYAVLPQKAGPGWIDDRTP